MERKIPFAVSWIPRIDRVKRTKSGHFLMSPAFATEHNHTVFKWKICFYPNGCTTSKNDGSDEDSEDNSAVFLCLQPFTSKSRWYFKFRATVEMEIASKKHGSKLRGRLENELFRARKYKEIKLGDQPRFLKGIRNLGPKCTDIIEDLAVITDDRIQVKCRLMIEASAFFQYNRYHVPRPTYSYLLAKKMLQDENCVPNLDQNDDTGSDDVTVGSDKMEDDDDNAEMLQMTAEIEGCLPPISVADFQAEVDSVPEKPDITLQSNDGQIFKCHYKKLAVSKVLAAQFNPDHQAFIECTTRCVTLDDVDSKTLNCFLFFLYARRLAQNAKEILAELLYVAEKYMVEDLREICEILMLQDVNTSNVLHYLKTAIRFNVPALKDACVDVIVCEKDVFFDSGSPAHQKLIDEPNLCLDVMKLLSDRISSGGICIC